MAMLSDWNPYERYVQGGFKDGEFANAGVSSALTPMASGGPYLISGVMRFRHQMGTV